MNHKSKAPRCGLLSTWKLSGNPRPTPEPFSGPDRRQRRRTVGRFAGNPPGSRGTELEAESHPSSPSTGLTCGTMSDLGIDEDHVRGVDAVIDEFMTRGRRAGRPRHHASHD